MMKDGQEITWEMTLKFFWAQIWRFIPFFIFIGGAAVGAYYYITEYLDVSPEAQSWMGAALGFYVGIVVALSVVRRLLTNGFGKYKLLIVPRDNQSTAQED